jgi:hypothetical protein
MLPSGRLISRLALSPRPASEIGIAQQTCGPTCRARKLAALRTVHQFSTAGLTRRLVARLLVFKERWRLSLPLLLAGVYPVMERV